MIKIWFWTRRFDKTQVMDNPIKMRKKLKEIVVNPIKLKEKLQEVVCTAIKRFHLPFQGKFIELDENTSTIDLLLVPSCGEKNRKGDLIYDFNKQIWNKRRGFEEAVNCEMVTYVDYRNQLDRNEYDVSQFSNDELENNDIGM